MRDVISRREGGSVGGRTSLADVCTKGIARKGRHMHRKTDRCRQEGEPVKLRKRRLGDHRVRILIVDDAAIFRKALWLFLLTEPIFELVGMACDGSEAIGKVEKLKPDLVIMDTLMPVMSGVEATRLITTRFPGTIVIGLSSVDSHAAREAMLNAGAADFFGKIEALYTLMPAIRRYTADRSRRERQGCA